MPMGCSAHSHHQFREGIRLQAANDSRRRVGERPGGDSPHRWEGGFRRSSQLGWNATVDEMAVRWFRRAVSAGPLLGEGARFD